MDYLVKKLVDKKSSQDKNKFYCMVKIIAISNETFCFEADRGGDTYLQHASSSSEECHIGSNHSLFEFRKNVADYLYGLLTNKGRANIS